MQAEATVEMGPGGGTVLQEKAGQETSPRHTILYLLLLNHTWKRSLCHSQLEGSFPSFIDSTPSIPRTLPVKI